jgi:asparagine synthase (glutamine-hydrolysing)
MQAEGFEDDFRYAQLVARQQGLTLHEVSGSLDIASELDHVIRHLGEPQADPAALHLSHIAAAAREYGIKVLLSGTGGDDVFSGYRRHTALPLLRQMAHLPKGVQSLASGLSAMFPGSSLLRRAGKLAGASGLSPLDAMIRSHFWAAPERIGSLFREGLLEADERRAYRFAASLWEEIPEETSDLNRMLFLEQRAFLPGHNLAYMDKLGMAHSVEIRVPFADRRMIDLAAALPPHLKLRGGTTKYILREVAKAYLPHAVIRRPKTGFGWPLRSWTKGEGYRLIRERLLDPSFTGRELFRKDRIESLIRNNQAGSIDGAYTLFSLLSIESWLRQFAPPA